VSATGPEGDTVLAASLQLDPGLVDACGAEPGIICELIYDWTGNSTAAEIAQVAAKPFTAVLILIAAWILNRIVRRTIDRFVDRLIEDREAKAEERKEAEADDGRFTRSWQRAVEKARLLADQADRSKQRAQALGTVLKVPTLEGEKPLDIPKGTQPGDIFTFSGEGIPSLRTRRRGDQIIQVDVKTPTHLNKKQEHLLREFAKLEKKKFSNKLKSLLKKRSA
jgi:hypothetical protein